MPDHAGETELARGPAAFPETCWTALLEGTGPEDPRCQVAVAYLVRSYWSPIYHFMRRRGRTVEDAKDLTQEFFTVILERDALRQADRLRGRFRTFLLACLTNFLHDEHDRRSALKRGGGCPAISLDDAGIQAEERGMASSGEESPEDAFNRRWALSLMASAEGRLRQECERRKDPATAGVFDWLVLRRGDHGGCTYAEAARLLDVTESRINALVAGARRLFRQMLREEVMRYSGPDASLDDEIDELLNALG